MPLVTEQLNYQSRSGGLQRKACLISVPRDWRPPFDADLALLQSLVRKNYAAVVFSIRSWTGLDPRAGRLMLAFAHDCPHPVGVLLEETGPDLVDAQDQRHTVPELLGLEELLPSDDILLNLLARLEPAGKGGVHGG